MGLIAVGVLAYLLTTNRWAYAAYMILVVFPISFWLYSVGAYSWFINMIWVLLVAVISIPYYIVLAALGG